MDEFIFGIKCNGVSINLSEITIDDDQSIFDYICNVSIKSSNNGNGTYDVSIVNKDYIPGIPVGKWRIKEAWIGFDWGDSYAYVIMEDEEGNATSAINASRQKGSMSGFHVPTLTKTIFTKAQEIVRKYPNAKICNAIMKVKKSEEKFDLSYLTSEYKRYLNKSDDDFIDFVGFAARKISKHLEVFNETVKILENNDDERSKGLIKDITSDCKRLLEYFKISD